MSLDLSDRSLNKCELCGAVDGLSNYSLDGNENIDKNVHICSTCLDGISNNNFDDHFRCLSGSMWSEHLPVQILSYRILSLMKDSSWASDLLSQMYLDDEALEIAQIGQGSQVKTLDFNKAKLKEGDDVTLIKDLVVKGANFTAKRGTMVKGIRLSDNPLHIEGRVNGTKIVIISDFVKKV